MAALGRVLFWACAAIAALVGGVAFGVTLLAGDPRLAKIFGENFQGLGLRPHVGERLGIDRGHPGQVEPGPCPAGRPISPGHGAPRDPHGNYTENQGLPYPWK